MPHLETEDNATSAKAALNVTIDGKGQSFAHYIEDGESILIGSDSHCRIRIPDPTVPERQCLLQFMQGDIFIHDWSPEHPTLVNGKPSDASVALTPRDRITFGEFELALRTGATAQPQSSDEELPASNPPATDTSAQAATEPTTPAATSAATSEKTLRDAVGLAEQVKSPEPAEAVEQFPEDDGWNAFTDSGPSLTPIPVEVSVEASTVALLTSEIESLQAELSEKNALLGEFERAPVSRPVDDEPSEIEQRIDQLLSELEHGDTRVEAVEEALRVCEETRHAELEEKRQLEQWVGDIEERVAARELEVTAECKVLRRKLEEASQERQQAEGQVSSLIGNSATDAALQDMVQVLRRENDHLRTKTKQAGARVAKLEKELAEAKREATEDAIQQRINEALRVERLQLAQERAAISRQQLELTAKTNELQQQLDRKNRLNPADDRFRVFREQLKELHEKEQEEYVPPTITQRLATLWQKLDGPTDTD